MPTFRVGVDTAGIIPVTGTANPAAMGGIVPGSIEVQIGQSAGDGDAGDGAAAAPVINLNYVECRANTSIWHRRIGWVFESCAIPKGATISSAKIQAHHINSAAYRDQYGDIYGEDTDSAALITTGAGDLWRTLTTASVSWIDTLTQNDWNDSPDISTVIQEIIDRPLWVSGNNICILVVPSHAVNYQARYIAYDGTPADAAKLLVSWG